MGLAASQARFLQLTARRTNIEYQGQQINQQRLALANASAGLFEKMLSLVPPTPPSSQDDKYYTQGYSFTDAADGIQKKISWTTLPNPDTIGVITITEINGTDTLAIDFGDYTGTVASTCTIAAALGVGYGTEADIPEGYRQEIRLVTVEHNIYDPDGQFTTVQNTTPALLVFDNLNRLISSTLLEDGMAPETLADGTTGYEQTVTGDGLTYAGVFDDTTYQDDMNKYEFEKASYDYQIERINQETKIIQSQDKSLELKMKQLDTEHNAIQTEIDAVQKVLQKNIEGSFKTFA